MDEREWLTSADPAAMLRLLTEGPHPISPGARASDRQLRLFACACCRLAPGRDPGDVDKWEEDGPPFGDLPLEWAQHWAKQTTEKHPDPTQRAALLRCIFGSPFRPMTVVLNQAYFDKAPEDLRRRVIDLRDVMRWHEGLVPRLAEAAYQERERTCERCLPTDRTWPIGGYCPRCKGTGRIDDGTLSPERLAILADALEEAGAPEELSRHLRGWERCPICTNPNGRMSGVDVGCTVCRMSPGWRKTDAPHVRGCHVIDLLTGRS